MLSFVHCFHSLLSFLSGDFILPEKGVLCLDDNVKSLSPRRKVSHCFLSTITL